MQKKFSNNLPLKFIVISFQFSLFFFLCLFSLERSAAEEPEVCNSNIRDGADEVFNAIMNPSGGPSSGPPSSSAPSSAPPGSAAGPALSHGEWDTNPGPGSAAMPVGVGSNHLGRGSAVADTSHKASNNLNSSKAQKASDASDTKTQAKNAVPTNSPLSSYRTTTNNNLNSQPPPSDPLEKNSRSQDTTSLSNGTGQAHQKIGGSAFGLNGNNSSATLKSPDKPVPTSMGVNTFSNANNPKSLARSTAGTGPALSQTQNLRSRPVGRRQPQSDRPSQAPLDLLNQVVRNLSDFGTYGQWKGPILVPADLSQNPVIKNKNYDQFIYHYEDHSGRKLAVTVLMDQKRFRFIKVLFESGIHYEKRSDVFYVDGNEIRPSKMAVDLQPLNHTCMSCH